MYSSICVFFSSDCDSHVASYFVNEVMAVGAQFLSKDIFVEILCA